MTMASIPHVVPPTIWTLTLDRVAVARLIAEIEWRVKLEVVRPQIDAVVTDEAATLYVQDHACSPQVLGLLAARCAVVARVLPDTLTHRGRTAVQQWATAPATGATGAQAAVDALEARRLMSREAAA
jgi:hypothetical protein